MIKKLLLSVFLLGGLVLFTSSQLSDNGKAGKTNAPGETTCVNSCHNSYALNAGPGSITMTAAGMPSFAYTPGQAYDITITVAQTGFGMFGIGVEALLASGANGGSFTITDAASTRIRTITVSGNVRNNVTHQLNGGLGTNSKAFNFKWTAPAAGSGNVTFYFSGVAANGTGNENGDYVYNSSQVVTEACAAPAQPNTISGTPDVCQGSSSQYSIAPVAGATSYTWTLPSGWTGTSTTETITATAGATTGDITVTANNTCGSSQAQTLTVTGNASPTPVINIINSAVDTLYCSTAWACQWYLNGNMISGANISSYVPTQNGTYTISVTDQNGCSGTSTDFNYITLGISQSHNGKQIAVYPAPASDYIFVSAPAEYVNQEISIMDVKGRIVNSAIVTDLNTKIDLSGIAEGLYFAVIGNDNNKSVTRFFITR